MVVTKPGMVATKVEKVGIDFEWVATKLEKVGIHFEKVSTIPGKVAIDFEKIATIPALVGKYFSLPPSFLVESPLTKIGKGPGQGGLADARMRSHTP
jgi:hypothetical protein